jgi:hypothetical protein
MKGQLNNESPPITMLMLACRFDEDLTQASREDSISLSAAPI